MNIQYDEIEAVRCGGLFTIDDGVIVAVKGDNLLETTIEQIRPWFRVVGCCLPVFLNNNKSAVEQWVKKHINNITLEELESDDMHDFFVLLIEECGLESPLESDVKIQLLKDIAAGGNH